MANAARLDVEAMLKPVSEESPSGPEREYEPDRQEIAEFFREPTETVDMPEHQRPDASQVKAIIKKIVSEGALSHDLNLPVYYIRAGAALGDLTTMNDGLLWLEGLIENFWDDVHPLIKDYDFDGRTAPLGELATPHGMLLNLKGVAAYTHKRLGTFTLNDLGDIASQQAMAPRYADMHTAVKDGGKEGLEETCQLLTDFNDRVHAVDSRLGELAEGGMTSPNLGKLYEWINVYLRGYAEFLEIETASTDDSQEAGEAAVAAGAQAAMAAAQPGRIATRQDVIRSIDAIIDYYDQQEPGSPVPVALRKVRNWVNLDFLALLREIAPDSVSTAKLQFRSDDENEDY